MGQALQCRWTRRYRLPKDRRTLPPFGPRQLTDLRNELNRTAPDQPLFRSIPHLLEHLRDKWGLSCVRETLRKAVRKIGYTYKKTKKVLIRACAKKRSAYQEKMKRLLAQARRGERTLVFADPAHIHQDVDTGYGWGRATEPLFVASPSLPRSKKVTFFGFYLYNQGEVILKPATRANAVTVRDALRALKDRLQDAPKITVVWDGAPYHRTKEVLAYAAKLGMEVVPLPGYSPDLMPVEELWNWFRQEVTRNRVFATREDLIQAAYDFEDRVNALPYLVADRLVVIEDLNPDFEKLLAS